MDEALVEAAIDTGGRAYYVGDLPTSLADHFFQSLSTHLAATLHIRVIRGRNHHHVIEAAVKATGLALRQALEEGDSLFSTKGQVRVTRDPAPDAQQPVDELLPAFERRCIRAGSLRSALLFGPIALLFSLQSALPARRLATLGARADSSTDYQVPLCFGLAS